MIGSNNLELALTENKVKFCRNMATYYRDKARDHALRQAVYDGDYDKYKSLQEEYDYQLFYHLKADSVQVTWGDNMLRTIIHV